MFACHIDRSGARLAGALFLALGSVSAAAQTIVSFSGGGTVNGPAQTPPVLAGLTLSASSSNYTFGGSTGWTAVKLFGFNTSTLTGGGSFTFTSGANALTGTFTSARANMTAPTSLTYTVTGGTGLYAGLAGSGFAWGTTTGNPFMLPAASVRFDEGGYFSLSPVPEPASALLLALGLGVAVATVKRRRG